jgi:hypothetical protein
MASYRQFSGVQNLGDKGYFPLRISKTSLADGLRETTRVFERYVFLTSYEEAFEANWEVGNRPLGRLNPEYNYKQTIRKVNITFKLPARNVAEAKSNLDFCSGLANIVYGDYARVGDTGDSFVYQGANSRNKIKFGNLLRNELCFFEEFSFSPNFDAGVFEYNGTQIGVVARQNENSPPTVGQLQEEYFERDMGPGALIEETQFVYHNQKGKVYPKEVSVTLSALIVVEIGDFLGFGGPNRSGEYQKRWSLNTGKDWPHGTGPIGVMRYMAATTPDVATEGGELSDDELLQNYLEERTQQLLDR